MKLFLNRTGDPWMDWGLVTLSDLAHSYSNIFSPFLDFGGLNLDVRDIGQASALLAAHMQEELNGAVVLPPEAKLLGLAPSRDGNGFLDPRSSWSLDDKLREQCLNRFREFIAKKARKDVNDKDLKMPNFKPNNSATAGLKRNYPGITNDWVKLAEGHVEDIAAFFAQWEQGGDKACSLCGRDCSIEYDMRQNKNPFYNQHHNNVVRGHRASVTVARMCPTCNLLNTLAASAGDLPYFVEGGRTHLIVPQVDDLTILAEVRALIRNNAVDLASPLLISYKTNIRNLPGGQADLYTSLIGVYWNLRHKYTRDPGTDLESWDFGLSLDKQARVRRWVVFRYSKGTNVSFAHFNLLDVNNRLFKLVETLSYGPDGDREGDLYSTLLRSYPTATGSRSREEFSRGLVDGNWRQVGVALLSLFKEGNSLAVPFARPFFDYALEVDNVLEKQLLEDVRTVGGLIGKAFAADVGLMSSINNANDEASLRRVMKDAFLKMHKIASTTKRFGGEDVWIPGNNRVENILTSVTRENVAEIRDTMLIYATLAAMHELRKKDKGGNE